MATRIAIAYGTLAFECWRSLKLAMFDTYRPELHYMRGPGPKCHERHGGRHQA